MILLKFILKIMECVIRYILIFFNYIEHTRKLIYEVSSPWMEQREIISNKIGNFEKNFRNYNPFTLIIGFLIFFFFLRWILKKLRNIYRALNSFEKIKETFYRLVISLSSSTRAKIENSRIDLRKKLLEGMKGSQFKKFEFRDKGQDYKTILHKLSSMNCVDKENIGGPNTKITGSIYITDSDLENIVGEVSRIYGYSNLLHPDVFSSARFLEANLVKLGVDIFNGNKDNCCGITTTGGSQSILFACMAYRNRGFKSGIKHPEIIVPTTAHAAFDKACDVLNIKIVKIPVDKNSQVDVSKVSRAINRNTVAIVGSAPTFAHGVMDDIEKLSTLAIKNNIGLHVDSCLGGLLLAFYDSANIKIPKFDFRLPGVTSLSADFHKYGLSPKGASLLLYSSRELRKNQYLIYPRFTGGIYPSPGLEGSRSPVFAICSYAIMIFLGKNRYVAQAKAINEAVKKVKTFVRENCKGLEIIGDPQICAVGITGKNSTGVFDQMKKKGWHLNFIANPTGFNLVITSANIENVENGTYTNDLLESNNYINSNKNLEVSESTKLYGSAVDLPEGIVKDNLDIICDCMLDA